MKISQNFQISFVHKNGSVRHRRMYKVTEPITGFTFQLPGYKQVNTFYPKKSAGISHCLFGNLPNSSGIINSQGGCGKFHLLQELLSVDTPKSKLVEIPTGQPSR